jgi:hypothetical protein
VSDTWGLAKVVRKVEFKLLHLRTSPRVTSPSVLVAEQSLPLCPILIGSRWCIQGCGTSEPLSASLQEQPIRKNRVLLGMRRLLRLFPHPSDDGGFFLNCRDPRCDGSR